MTGNEKIPYDSIPLFINVPNDDLLRFQLLFYWHFRHVRQGKQMLTEILTINADRTSRYYMFVPTCIAKIYRKVHEAASHVYKDNMIDFMTFSVTTVKNKDDEKLKDLSIDERANYGEDYLTGYAYLNKKFYMMSLPIKSDFKNILLKEVPSLPNLYLPIVIRINMKNN